MGAEVDLMRERRWLGRCREPSVTRLVRLGSPDLLRGLFLAVALLLVPRAAYACPS
jgi:hypothetical protein